MSASTSTTSRPAAGLALRDRLAGASTAVLGLLAGATTALVGLAVCSVVGLVGWYLSDAGGHGAPRSGVLAGARGWLVAHGAGLEVRGVAITLVPLGVTVLLGWLAWQGGLRLGEMVWGHGPDEARRGDGARDLTVPVAVGAFTVGYLLVAAITLSLASGDGWDGALGPVLRWGLLFSVVLAGVGVAVGSGRVELWLEPVPWAVRDMAAAAGALVAGWLLLCLAVFVVAMVLGLGDAADAVDRLDTSRGETFLLWLACLVLVPHAVLYSSAFVLGPGFTVGVGTAVAPTGVLLGPLPLIPILGALPDQGDVPRWWVAHLAVPLVVAACVVARRQLRTGVVRWDSAALVGLGAGVGASAVVALLTAVAGGAAGPGRMADFGAPAGEVFLAALTPFALGGLAGALLGTWWVRRTAGPVAEFDETADEGTHEAVDEDGATQEHPVTDVEQTAEVPAAAVTSAVHDSDDETTEVKVVGSEVDGSHEDDTRAVDVIAADVPAQERDDDASEQRP